MLEYIWITGLRFTTVKANIVYFQYQVQVKGLVRKLLTMVNLAPEIWTENNKNLK
jgi:hypothetical protein